MLYLHMCCVTGQIQHDSPYTGLTVPERVEVLQVWSRPDIAREELFKPDTHWQVRLIFTY